MAKQLTLGFLLLLLSLPAWSQTEFGSVQEAYEYAMAHGTAVERERLLAENAQSQRNSQMATLLPQVKAIANFDNYFSLPVQLVPAEIFGGEPGTFRELQFGTQYQLNYGLEANMPLVNVSAWKSLQASQLAAEAAFFQQKSQEQLYKEEVSRAYYLYLLSREALALSEKNLASNDTLLRAAQVKFEQGLIELLDYNRAQALHVDATQQVLDNRVVLQSNAHALKLSVGLALEDSLELSEGLNDPLLQAQSLQAAPEELPQYRTLDWSSKKAEAELSRQQMRYLPEVSAYARYTRQAQRNELNFAQAGESWFEIGVVGLRAEWLLFNGMGRNSQVSQAKRQSEIARLQKEEYGQKATKELLDLHRQSEQSTQAVKAYQRHRQLTEQNYALALRKFNEGVYSFEQLVSIYLENIQSQQKYLSKLSDYYLHQAMIAVKNESVRYENASYTK
ncbi:TolC family protein [Cytophagales bacterium LB-30]|uniref:TolC family protein n=1 Tax=Shiella aurantiaca TaxID=3058365 RepID=A0ABT8F2T1_9BACT|nr:TolC family protein [Shiella aurantiaca]MDN4164659.1 TolC family protein [Shiella aurantiaca]